MSEFGKFVGIPYVNGGRTEKGLDCLGLIRYVFEINKNIILPYYVGYSQNWYRSKEPILLNKLKEFENLWTVVEPPYKKYDGLLFYTGRKEVISAHMGLWVGNNKFLHTNEFFMQSIISKFDNYWKSKLYKVIRYSGDLNNG